MRLPHTAGSSAGVGGSEEGQGETEGAELRGTARCGGESRGFPTALALSLSPLSLSLPFPSSPSLSSPSCLSHTHLPSSLPIFPLSLYSSLPTAVR